MAGTWATIGSSGAPRNAGTMLLLTDGSVLCHDEPNTKATVSGSNRWYKLAPGQRTVTTAPAHGRHSPTGRTRRSTSRARCCATAVFVAGGEYNGGNTQVELLAAEIYDPVATRGRASPRPRDGHRSATRRPCVLNDGRVLLGDINSKRSRDLRPVVNTWTAGRDEQGRSAMHRGDMGPACRTRRCWRSSAITDRAPRST